MVPNIPKIIAAALASLYFLSIAYDPMSEGLWNFLNFVDLPIHETGHLLFRPFGEFMMVAGGSVFQVLFPAAFVAYFLWHRNPFSAAMVFFWVGQSVLNVWVYANDADVMRLVLTSGLTGSEGGFHDWNYLLTRTGLLESKPLVAGAIRAFGTIAVITSSAAAFYFSFIGESEKES